jgi:hypothetical protein
MRRFSFGYNNLPTRGLLATIPIVSGETAMRNGGDIWVPLERIFVKGLSAAPVIGYVKFTDVRLLRTSIERDSFETSLEEKRLTFRVVSILYLTRLLLNCLAEGSSTDGNEKKVLFNMPLIKKRLPLLTKIINSRPELEIEVLFAVQVIVHKKDVYTGEETSSVSV